jgi:hypothetical protein
VSGLARWTRRLGEVRRVAGLTRRFEPSEVTRQNEALQGNTRAEDVVQVLRKKSGPGGESLCHSDSAEAEAEAEENGELTTQARRAQNTMSLTASRRCRNSGRTRGTGWSAC